MRTNWEVAERFAAPEYSHTQRAPLCLALYGAGAASVVMGVVFGLVLDHNLPALWISLGSGLVHLLLGAAFQHLTVEDDGSQLSIRFGPLPLFRRRVPYADIQQVAIGRTTLLDGWGIHRRLRGGSVWNLWGFDCVELDLPRGKLRIGTDDPQGLARFVAQRIGRPVAGE